MNIGLDASVPVLFHAVLKTPYKLGNILIIPIPVLRNPTCSDRRRGSSHSTNTLVSKSTRQGTSGRDPHLATGGFLPAQDHQTALYRVAGQELCRDEHTMSHGLTDVYSELLERLVEKV